MTIVNCKAINSNIIRILRGGRSDVMDGDARGSLRLGCVLSLHSFPKSPGRSGFVGSFGVVLGSSSIGVIIRAVNKLRPTFRFISSLLGTNGDIMASGGRLITRGNCRLLALTSRGGMGFLFRTSMNNNVPVVHPVSRYLTTGRVSRVTNVLGNAAGFVLAVVVRRGVDFRRTLGLTRSGNCTRGSPATSIRKVSTYHGVYVLTSLYFNGRICPSDIRARNVSGVALRSITCIGSFNNIVGLLNGTEHRGNNGVSTVIYPYVIGGRDRLTSMDSMFGTVLIHNSTVNSIMFCNENTNGLPATDTIITSMVSYTGRRGHGGLFN